MIFQADSSPDGLAQIVFRKTIAIYDKDPSSSSLNVHLERRGIMAPEHPQRRPACKHRSTKICTWNPLTPEEFPQGRGFPQEVRESG